jgi:hypothetical protein
MCVGVEVRRGRGMSRKWWEARGLGEKSFCGYIFNTQTQTHFEVLAHKSGQVYSNFSLPGLFYLRHEYKDGYHL